MAKKSTTKTKKKAGARKRAGKSGRAKTKKASAARSTKRRATKKAAARPKRVRSRSTRSSLRGSPQRSQSQSGLSQHRTPAKANDKVEERDEWSGQSSSTPDYGMDQPTGRRVGFGNGGRDEA